MQPTRRRSDGQASMLDFFFTSRRRHTRCGRDWSSDVCSSDLSAEVRLEGDELILTAEDETKLRNMNDILQQKLVRRSVPLKALSYGRVEPAAGGTLRQHVRIQQGIPTDKAKEIVKFIKETKLKAQAAIQGDIVRVSGRDRDTLQDVIARLKAKDFGINMQYTNYRTN